MLKPTAKLTRFLASSLVMTVSVTAAAAGKCACDPDDLQPDPKTAGLLLPYKVAALFEILAAGAVGVVIPLGAGRKLRVLRPDGDVFFMIKAFAAGVILATGFVHILPDAFGSLRSPCLSGSAFGDFPFAGFVAMTAAVGTLMVDCAAAGYYRRLHFGGKSSNKGVGAPASVVGPADDDEESGGDHDGHMHVHTHATHGHAHGDAAPPEEEMDGLDLIKQRVTSQVLEVGVMVHSVIIGVTLGASGSLVAVKPLTVALSFHQFFEGMGLAGCIAQAKFKLQTMLTMAIFFSLTTPLGIGIGIGVSSVYSESSPTALIVQGILGAASAGILIYMALVDLLAADFKNPKVQQNPSLQLGTNISLFLGAGCMSVLAIWA